MRTCEICRIAKPTSAFPDPEKGFSPDCMICASCLAELTARAMTEITTSQQPIDYAPKGGTRRHESR